MSAFLQIRIGTWAFIAMMIGVCGANSPAEPVPVHHQEGTVHGFLDLRSEDGQVLASGDSVQVAHGDQINTRTIFHFKDGSIDDETTVLSQRHNLQLISDHPHPAGAFLPSPFGCIYRLPQEPGHRSLHRKGW